MKITNKTDSFYKKLNSSQEDSKSQVIPNGKTWRITNFVADLPSTNSDWVALVFDHEGPSEQWIAVLYRSDDRALSYEITGDGVKELKIILHHGPGSPQVLGGTYEAFEK